MSFPLYSSAVFASPEDIKTLAVSSACRNCGAAFSSAYSRAPDAQVAFLRNKIRCVVNSDKSLRQLLIMLKSDKIILRKVNAQRCNAENLFKIIRNQIPRSFSFLFKNKLIKNHVAAPFPVSIQGMKAVNILLKATLRVLTTPSRFVIILR